MEYNINFQWGFNVKRSLETSTSADSTDIYFSNSIFGSTNIMFSFNQHGKKYIIGNLQLTKDKYYTLKQKLLEEIADELEKNKTFPSLFDILKHSDEELELEKITPPKIKHKNKNIDEITNGFRTTTKILLGHEMDLENMAWYLKKYIANGEIIKTPLGNDTAYFNESIFSHVDKKRAIRTEEQEEFAKLSLKEEEIENIDKITKNIGKIATFLTSLTEGNTRNVILPYSAAYNSTAIFHTFDGTHSKNIAYNLNALNDSFVYGCSRILNSTLIIRGHNSYNITRGIEIDSCNQSSDIYFSHKVDSSNELHEEHPTINDGFQAHSCKYV